MQSQNNENCSSPEFSAMQSEYEAVNILLVDDKPKNLIALEEVLAGPEYRIVKAESGREALGLVLKENIAMILLDINMPIMDGFETARLIRNRKKTSDIPIIFISADYIDQDFIAKGYALNAVDYIVKPFNPDILRTRVALLADLHRKAVALEKTNKRLSEEIQERKRAEDNFAQRLAQQERETLFLENLVKPTETTITAKQFGSAPLRESLPDIYAGLVDIYEELMDLAVEQQNYVVDHDLSGKLRLVADRLGFLKAGPRDLIEILSTALKNKIQESSKPKRQAYSDEARIMIIESMGYLAAYYRNIAFGC